MMNGLFEAIRFDQAQDRSRSDRHRLKGLFSSRRPFGGPERDGEWKKFGLHEALLYGRVAIHERESLQFRRGHEHDYPEGTVVRIQRAARHKYNALCHQPLEVAEVFTNDRHFLVGRAFDQHGRSDRFMAVKELLHQRVQIRFVSIVKQTIGPQFEPCRINMQRLKLK
jgi:hypothetical protein